MRERGLYLVCVYSAVREPDNAFDLIFVYRVAQKWHSFWYALTSSNINRFLKLFHYQNQEKICNIYTSSVSLHYLVKCQVS